VNGDGDIDILERGSTIGRYMIVERLGAGAMGVVYAAYDPELDRKVAIKILRPQQGSGDLTRRRGRLVREAKAIAKLSHPNVVGIFDVGVHDGQVFLAMEYLSGGTLRDWLDAKKRPWREVVKLFIEVGKGLSAAHVEGLIHRDFKPDNVLLDKSGQPKVVDFGLVRLATGADLEGSSNDLEATVDEGPVTPPPASATPEVLTKTGAMAGTPAYMAPEQFLGKAIDARTDQFAFSVALYEALYGERPFAGDTIFALASSVTDERVRLTPRRTDIPAWIRRCILRGLRADPAQRYASIEDLIVRLSTDPVARLRKGVVIGGTLAIVAVTFFGLQRRAERRRIEFEQQIAVRVAEGRRGFTDALRLKQGLRDLRASAFKALDGDDRENGERIWSDALVVAADTDATLQRAEGAMEAALNLDRARTATREALSDVIYERALLAELEYRRQDVQHHIDRLAAIDPAGKALSRWSEAGTLTLTASPLPVTVTLEQYVDDRAGKRNVTTRWRGQFPLQDHKIEPGTYRAVMTTSAGEIVDYPFRVGRGEHVTANVELPAPGKIPAGFSFVPAGEVLVGDYDESMRKSFLYTVPIHPVHARAFLISKHEVTYGDWISFLNGLPAAERDRRIPAVSTKQGGAANPVYVRLRLSSGAWHIELGPAEKSFEAGPGESISYPDRKLRSEQRWERMPVSGISAQDMEAYLLWLRARVPGARFCTDLEWERAARGADDRIFSHGDTLNPEDANFDLTYGRRPLAFGPDEVGSHPASASPFGVQDMTGNIFEIVQTRAGSDEYSARGGAYYYARATCRLTNREPVVRSLRYPTFGFRVCADSPLH
jgi:formylglycine-generating enzyme required for sulfatase activity